MAQKNTYIYPVGKNIFHGFFFFFSKKKKDCSNNKNCLSDKFLICPLTAEELLCLATWTEERWCQVQMNLEMADIRDV